MKVDFNRHREFNGRISRNIYNCLEILSKVVHEQEIPSVDDVSLLKTIRMITTDIDKLVEDKMKSSIYYIRLCKIIDELLKEYEKYDDKYKKTVIDYYIQSNTTKEINNIGFAWYYDMKYKKDTATLYSVGYSEPSNWHKWIKKRHKESNQLKERGVQEIFKACNEHINRGGEIRLKSLSKCLGIDLFKYMQLDKNDSVNLYIIKNAPTNFIKYNNNKVSLQEYLPSDDVPFSDGNIYPDFCLDFSHPRGYESKNYNKWSKNFLGNEFFISKKELEDKKSSLGMKDDVFDYFIWNCLKSEHTRGGDRAVSSRVSPIADKEVVASDTLWEIEEYAEIEDCTEIANFKPIDEKCYCITFNELEYYQLIFSYFKSYHEKKCGKDNQKPFEEKYSHLISREKEEVKKMINALEEKNEKLTKRIEDLKKKNDKPADGLLQNEDIKNNEKNIDDNKVLIDFYRLYEKSLDTKVLGTTNTKIQFALSFVDWQAEDVPEEWSLSNIYTLKENKNKEKNLILNLYKYFCKGVVFA